LYVSHDDGEGETYSGDGSNHEKDHREAGVAQDAKRSFDAHQHCSSDDEGGEHEAQADPVRHFLKSLNQDLLVNRVDIDLQLVIADCVKNLVDAARQLFHELFEFDNAANNISRRDAFH